MKALYVTDRAAIGDTRFGEVLDVLSGAADLSVELREKSVQARALLDLAIGVRRRLGAGVPLYVNGRFDVALASGADGVHLPSDGLPLESVRAHTPREFRIGVSTHSAAEAEAAIAGGADLVVVGPIFATPSKPEVRPLGPEALGGLPLRASHASDVYALGGIEEANLDRLEPYRDRIAGVAGIRLFQESSDPRATSARIAAR